MSDLLERMYPKNSYYAQFPDNPEPKDMGLPGEWQRISKENLLCRPLTKGEKKSFSKLSKTLNKNLGKDLPSKKNSIVELLGARTQLATIWQRMT